VVALAKLLRNEPDHFFTLTENCPCGTRARAKALGELGGLRAQDALKHMLEEAAQDQAGDSATTILPAVLQALAQAQTPDLGTILPPYLMSHDGVVLRAALAAYAPPEGAASAWKPVLQAYANVADSSDSETKIAILDRLADWLTAAEVQSFLRTRLRDRERIVRIAAARLLKQAGATGIPDDPGPAASNATDQTYTQAAAARQDRTIAVVDTNRGTIEIELYRQDAPLTVANFVALANKRIPPDQASPAKNSDPGFFDGLSFMRVVPYSVVQSGDPRNDQEGGPGYTIRCEINMHPFERGSVGMWLSGKDTGGSQFFITLSPQPDLDGRYTCFGRVISGIAVAEHLIAGDRILRIRIVEDKTMLDFRRY
jgi:cyclophilin family peptidyl-prolyl cis-trans isomerase